RRFFLLRCIHVSAYARRCPNGPPRAHHRRRHRIDGAEVFRFSVDPRRDDHAERFARLHDHRRRRRPARAVAHPVRHAGIVGTLERFRPAGPWDWTNFWMHTYVLLRPGASPADLEAKISDLTMVHFGEQLAEYGGHVELGLQPLTSIHLDSGRTAELVPAANRTYLYAFGVIAALVLLIACINFMNLATARSLERAKETGIRKAIGSTRPMLARQFLTEATLFSVLALLLSLAIAGLALPQLNALIGMELSLRPLLEAGPFVALVAAGLVVGLISGTYPA